MLHQDFTHTFIFKSLSGNLQLTSQNVVRAGAGPGARGRLAIRDDVDARLHIGALSGLRLTDEVQCDKPAAVQIRTQLPHDSRRQHSHVTTHVARVSVHVLQHVRWHCFTFVNQDTDQMKRGGDYAQRDCIIQKVTLSPPLDPVIFTETGSFLLSFSPQHC